MHEADKATTTRWRLAGVAAVLALCAGGAGASGQAPSAAAIDAGQSLVKTTCVGCHSDRTRSGGLSLQSFDLATAGEHSETAEKMIRKLRAGQMPTPGRRTFQRLNRAEYASSIRDLLALDINAGDYLPLDAKSANFDNIADAQL